MTDAEAKRILLTHRPGQDATGESDVAAALEQTRCSPALAQWWKQQQEFHAAMKAGFAQARVPSELRERIRAHARIIPFPWWKQPRVWAAAAAIVLLVGLAAVLWQPAPPGDSFATYRSRMVRSVLRTYRMDVHTNDFASIRAFLATNKAPADFKMPPALEQLRPSGGGVLSWQASPVSMVCLDSGTQGTLFLFVINRSEVKGAPGPTPEFARVSKLTTASWVQDEKVYVLAMDGEADALKKFF